MNGQENQDDWEAELAQDPDYLPWLISTYKENDMSLLMKSSGGGDYEMAPAGAHAAICYSIVDIGFQRSEYQGEVKYLPKVISLGNYAMN